MSGMGTTASPLAAPIKAKLDAKRTEAREAGAAFQELRASILKTGVEAADLVNPESEHFKRLDAAAAQKQTLDTEAKGMEDQLFRLLEIEGMSTEGYEPADPNARANDLPKLSKTELQGFAERILKGEAYADMASTLKRGGGKVGWGGTKALGEPMKRGELLALMTGASDTSGGAFVVTDRRGYVPLAERALSLRNLVTVGTTDSDTFDYVVQTSHTTGADWTAEATTVAPGAEDGLKPEGGMDFDVETDTVRNLAELIPVTRRAFQDAGQLRAIIDRAMRYAHVKKVEDEMATGSGVGDHLRGITNWSGVNTFDANTAHENDLEAVRKGMTLIQLDDEGEPSGVLVNPADAELQDLIRDDSGAGAGTGGYLSGSPWAAGPRTLWGLPRIVTNACPVGKAIVGDFMWATLLLAGGMDMLVSDSHKDWFQRNVLALLLEARYGFYIERPAAFAVVTFDR